MPDLDIVERGLCRHWRRPYRLIKGGHPSESVGEAVIKATAATLREDQGIPALGSLCDACNKAYSDPSGVKTLAEVGRSLEQEFGQQPAVKLAARSAQRSLIELQYGRALPGPVALAKEYLKSLLRHHFFAKVITGRLVGEGQRFHDIQEARQFESRIWSHIEPQLIEIARRLVADPTASTLRAPNSPRRRRTTAELLEAPLIQGS
jgi:hypothetical protein